MKIFILAGLFAYAFATGGKNSDFRKGSDENTGSTPPPIDECLDSLCNGKSDGNYEVNGHPHHFVSCVKGNPDCMACWPQTLIYSGKCNQCLYKKNDKCYTTAKFAQSPSFSCPDECPGRGPTFSGNIKDTNEKRHYVACWEGVTVGCINCPAGLLFNEGEKACLYEGEYMTEPQ